MEFEKLQTASLKELFISSVEDKILSGELPIGAQLPTERELAEMMDVSRGVVNSGIAEMAHKGFLEVRPRVGTFVADYRRVGKSDIFLSIMHYNGGILPEQEIRSLLEFKSLIDCFSVRKLTARAITEAEVQKLEDFVDQMAETDDPQRPLLTVEAANPIKKQAGRREYLRGTVAAVDGRWQVKTTGNQGSGVLRSMSEANCFVVLPENCAGIQVGDSVQVQLFEGVF